MTNIRYALDIAVVAQKVKAQCCYIMADMLNLKKWGWVINRSGWLLELLTKRTPGKVLAMSKKGILTTSCLDD